MQTPIRDLIPVPRIAARRKNPADGIRAEVADALAVVERNGGGPGTGPHRPLVSRKSRAALLISFQRLRSERTDPISAFSCAKASSPASLR
jgi:hypothetical protein